MNLPLGAPGPGHLRRHSNLAASPPNKSAPVTPLNRSTSNVNAASSSIPYSAVYVFCANNYVGSPLKVRSEIDILSRMCEAWVTLIYELFLRQLVRQPLDTIVQNSKNGTK